MHLQKMNVTDDTYCMVLSAVTRGSDRLRINLCRQHPNGVMDMNQGLYSTPAQLKQFINYNIYIIY